MMDDNLSFINFETFKTRYVNTPGINFLEFNGIVRAARRFLTMVKNNPNIKSADSLKDGGSATVGF